MSLSRKHIGITGHTAGIGAALYAAFADSHEVRGYSRENGFDLSSAEARARAADLICQECDVFINNAYSTEERGAQLLLLREIYSRWKETDKIILVNTSMAPAFQKWHEPRQDLAEYVASKQELIDECERILFSREGKCRVVNIKLGFVDTALTARFQFPKMQPRDVVPFFELAMRDPLVWELGVKL